MTIDTPEKLRAIRGEVIEDAAEAVRDELYKALEKARVAQRTVPSTRQQRATWTAVIHIYGQLIDQLDETGFLPAPEEVKW
jgi:hypothetical protein